MNRIIHSFCFVCALVAQLLAVVLIPTSFSYADELPVHEAVIQPHASAGTLIAAVLESSGYKALSIVLEDLNSTIFGLGGLIFLVVIVIGLYQLAVGDKLKQAAWMLIGPPTFFFLINAQVNAAGATWQFGTYDGTRKVEVVLGDAAETQSKVPWLFHRFNLVISSAIQELVKILTSYDEDDQLRFMARPHLSDYLTSAKIGSPQLSSLIHFSFAQCGQGLESAAGLIGNVKSSSDGTLELVNGSSSQKTALASLEKNLNSKNVTIGNGAWREPLLATMRNLKRDGTDGVRWQQLSPFHSCLTNYVFSNGSDPEVVFAPESVVSCNTLWCMVGAAANYEAAEIVARGQDVSIPKEASDEIVTQIVNDVRKKLTHDIQSQSKPLEQSVGELQYVVGGLLIRDFMQDSDHTAYLGRSAERWRYRTNNADNKSQYSRESLMNEVRADKMEQLPEREKIQMYVFTQLLPYMQGIILYILAISYPFCALFVLIPDKATNFLIWFAAWTWAKSWDVGWAVVMVIENLLWEFMPLDAVNKPSDSFDVVTMMDQAYSSNHTNTLATYYVIVSMMLGAVPVVTARVLLGSKSAMGQHLINGLQKVTNNMGEKLSRRKAITQLRTVTSQKSQGMQEFIGRGMSAALFGSFENGKILDQSGNEIPLNSDLGKALSRMYSSTEFQAARSNIERNLDVGNKGVDVTTAGLGALLTGAAMSGSLQARLAKEGLALAGGVPALSAANKMYRTLHRSAVNQQYKLAQAVGEFMAYEYGFTEQFRYLESRRAAISDRGEFFTFPDIPTGAMVSFSNIAAQSASTMVGSYGASLGAGIGIFETGLQSKTVFDGRGPLR